MTREEALKFSATHPESACIPTSELPQRLQGKKLACYAATPKDVAFFGSRAKNMDEQHLIIHEQVAKDIGCIILEDECALCVIPRKDAAQRIGRDTNGALRFLKTPC